MAARRREHRDGDVQARAVDGAAGDRLAVAGREAVEVARGRHARVESAAEEAGDLEDVLLREALARRLRSHGHHREVHVRIDEAGQEERTAQVDRLGVEGPPGAGVGDHSVADLDLGVDERSGSGAVDEGRTDESEGPVGAGVSGRRAVMVESSWGAQLARLNPGEPGSASRSRWVYQCCGSA